MCGRVYYRLPEEYWMATFQDGSFWDPRLEIPNYNGAPTQQLPVVHAPEGKASLAFMRWGLVPVWEKEFSTKLTTINAKSETLPDSRLYKGLVSAKRCVIPISGFFEWKKEAGAKRPFKIFMKGEPILLLAGLWNTWHAGSPDAGQSFTILTTAANSVMASIHDRMPVILSKDQWRDWLSPDLREMADVTAMTKPCPPEWLETQEISTLVNSVRNNRPEVLEPV